MIDEASLFQAKAGANFAFDDAISAEVLMLNRGLGAYDKKLFLSNTDYSKVAKDLGTNQYNEKGVVLDALTKATIPNLATFDTMRSDYLINLPANVTAGLVINGNQSHTVATYDANDFYLDNRSMTLLLTGSLVLLPLICHEVLSLRLLVLMLYTLILVKIPASFKPLQLRQP